MTSLPSLSVRREDPLSEDARVLLDELSATLALYSGDSGQDRFRIADVAAPAGSFAIARAACGTPLGCGAFRHLTDGVAEVKRLYSRRGTRGVGRAILNWIELEAAAAGYRALCLETRAVNRRAIAFYQRNGFIPVQPFGAYSLQADARCFGKPLLVAGW